MNLKLEAERWLNSLENKDLTTLQETREALRLKVKTLETRWETGFSSQSPHEIVPFITALNMEILKLTEEITDLQEERKTLVLKNKELAENAERILSDREVRKKYYEDKRVFWADWPNLNLGNEPGEIIEVQNKIKEITKEQEETNKRILEIDAKILKITTKETIEPKEETKKTTTAIIQNEGLPPVAIFGIVSVALGAFVMIVLITIHFKNKFKKQKASKIKWVE